MLTQLTAIDWRPFIPIFIIYGLLLVSALQDIIRHRAERRHFWLWLSVIVLITTFGPVLYFLFGRRQNA
ncbi:PLD nuclease N-terminal domain-containing protein [Vagococcus acidifermentans]|uniref:Cardiolipin synthase N-terminal domain-containing protein n=1 Tax=Vagococcus acidifermentans TaxID=564710 RepID=A0A430AP47_9ENTE|nr:PLD nuclease N-terminal domain-containing protein [Vagococcus acidifermentans]RSU09918.1 hypothetical protein CBF27_11500 [Vagococcus acidifermentans]